MSRRENGLPQTSTWTRLTDVEPVMADRLVELLGDAGVAAYAAASEEGSLPVPLSTPVASRPSDRVFVGQRDVDLARQVMDRHLPALRAEQQAAQRQPEPDVEAAFASIIAGWDSPSDRVGAWSALEDLPGTTHDAASGCAGTAELVDDGWGQAPPTSGPAIPASDDPQDHFVPPPPPPLPVGDRISRAAWAGLIGGPLVLMLAVLTGAPADGWLGLGAVLVTLAGFATLVARMKDRPARDDDPDDGAVV